MAHESRCQPDFRIKGHTFREKAMARRMSVARALGAAGAGLTGLLAAALTRAGEPLPTSAEHVATPARSVASDDSSQAVVLNPANLAWLAAPELRWTWVHCPDSADKVGCGHA